MTKLTNEQKFSPVYGFEPGVVVEIRFDGEPYIEWFADLCGPHIRIHERYQEAKTSFPGDLIESIRILSGPFGVWQFAPLDSIGLVRTKDNKSYYFFDDKVAFDGLRSEDMSHENTYELPPWWWLEAKEEGK